MTLELTTPRLVLDAPKREDAPTYAKAIDNINVARFLNPVALPYTADMARDWIASLPENTPENATFIIQLPGTGLIGAISINDLELGYWIAEPYWGNGNITEAAVAVLCWHFTNTDATSVPSAAHFDNPASRVVQRKLGFIECGTKTRFSISRQCEVEHIVTTLTREAFRKKGYMS